MQVLNKRWKRWGAGLAGAVGVYALAGGWLLPQVIKSQLPKFVETELERKASIGEVSFNPFTLRLAVRQFQLIEANGAPLFGVGALEVEMQWRSLLRRAWSFADIRIVAPSVQLAIAADGKFNIAEFVATLNKRKHDDSDSGMPRLVIEHFALEQGKVDMHDRHAGYNDTYAPIAFTLNNLSTLPDENGDYTLSADAGLGGKLRWKGTAALNPIAGSGLLTLENVALAGMATYLKSFARVAVVDGRLSAKLPYKFAYKDGLLDAGLSGAGLALNDLAVKRDGAAEAFVKLKLFDVSDVGVDLLKRTVNVGGLHVSGGALAVRRDARGGLDLAGLMVPAAPTPTATPAPAAAPASASAAASSAHAAAPAAKPAPAPAGNWKVHLKQLAFDDIAVAAVDETVSPALKFNADKLKLRLQLQAEPAADGLKLNIADASFSLDNLVLGSGALTPLKLAQLGFDGGEIDLAAHSAKLGRLYADGGQLDLSRDKQGKFLFLNTFPKSGGGAAQPAAKDTPAGAPWTANIKTVEFNKFGARYDDASTGIKANLQDFNLKLTDAGTDLKKPLAFDGSVGLREGGQLVAKGKVVPATGAVETDLKLTKLAIAPIQPLLSKHVKLKIADGSISGQGHLHTGAGGKADPSLRYDGSLEVAELTLNEEDNDRFAHWKTVRADKLAFSLSPDLLDVAELRVVQPDAALIIENDRSLNAQRLLVQQPADAAPATASAPAAKPAPAPAAAAEPFPVRVRRVRVENARLAFTDLSLRPQFSAKIYELGGVITGLSSRRDASSQIELDGRVDEFGLARIRGKLNPFVPADNTDVNVVFKNVDMVSASPYSMKFAGYKIAEGKISLDLEYKVRQGQLEGNNHIVLDKLTLGERIDSPDALKLPLELALAILKDSDGRIDLGVPVSGNMNDPQFSYGSVVWKAIGNIMTKIVTSPFRALGNLFGVSGDKLESIDFDPGSDVVLPPEREKLKQVAQILAKKAQLKLSVPGQYSVESDGAALRAQALRRVVLARAEVKLAAGEQPGPLDIGQRKVRGAMRDLYAERFGAAELDKQKKAAESAAPAAATAADASAAAQKKLPMLQRLGKMVQGEPQVADASDFYAKLQERLEKNQPLPADALPQLGAKRAAAILAALKDDGVDPAAAHAAAAETVDAGAGKPIALKLGLSAK
ncbi:DUF748 domain-containing protein [Duganella sp. HH105]|uniref:DUF748 domain-containing protein n=1 Tax=Duganella sp. HH105 TaxID=1781067 RepID=UPI000877BEF8|nr:DUF748 domain-containing protein [Duganella sp. HH105]OEZ54298.1 AsmA family protein [Duganella sp. HH105]